MRARRVPGAWLGCVAVAAVVVSRVAAAAGAASAATPVAPPAGVTVVLGPPPAAANTIGVALAVDGVAVWAVLPKGPAVRLDRATLGAMLGGRAARWDDAAVRALNPGRAMPPSAVTIGACDDGVAAVVTAWAGVAVRCGAGTVAGTLLLRPAGAPGVPGGAVPVLLQNGAGRFVGADPAALAAAAADATDRLPADGVTGITGEAGAADWPLAAFRYAVVRVPAPSGPAARAIRGWLAARIDGAPQAGTAALPPAAKLLALNAIAAVDTAP